MVGYVNLKISDIDFFCRDVNTFKSDVNAGEGHRVIDAKSLLSLLTLDLSKPVKIEVITEDKYEIDAFKDLLRRYKGEE